MNERKRRNADSRKQKWQTPTTPHTVSNQNDYHSESGTNLLPHRSILRDQLRKTKTQCDSCVAFGTLSSPQRVIRDLCFCSTASSTRVPNLERMVTGLERITLIVCGFWAAIRNTILAAIRNLGPLLPHAIFNLNDELGKESLWIVCDF